MSGIRSIATYVDIGEHERANSVTNGVPDDVDRHDVRGRELGFRDIAFTACPRAKRGGCFARCTKTAASRQELIDHVLHAGE